MQSSSSGMAGLTPFIYIFYEAKKEEKERGRKRESKREEKVKRERNE